MNGIEMRARLMAAVVEALEGGVIDRAGVEEVLRQGARLVEALQGCGGAWGMAAAPGSALAVYWKERTADGFAPGWTIRSGMAEAPAQGRLMVDGAEVSA